MRPTVLRTAGHMCLTVFVQLLVAALESKPSGSYTEIGMLPTHCAVPEPSRGKPLVVVVEDFEGMDAVTLSDLIVVCSHYRAQLPIFFIVGVASYSQITPSVGSIVVVVRSDW